MSEIPSLSGRDVLVLANALALILSEGKDTKELIFLGTLLTEVGSSLLTIAAIDGISASEQSDAQSAKISLLGRGML